jgi:hypothetical protein
MASKTVNLKSSYTRLRSIRIVGSIADSGSYDSNNVRSAGFAMIALPFALALMHSALLDLVGFAPDTSDAFWPAELAHTFISLRVAYQVVESKHI